MARCTNNGQSSAVLGSMEIVAFLLLASSGNYMIAAAAPPPHIVILFVDNLGWANVGYHRPHALPADQLSTPNIDALAVRKTVAFYYKTI